MKWVIIILIVLAVLVALALIAMAMKRKKQKVARQRAGELRSTAAQSAADKHEQEARAREAKAEADRARAEADKLDARAHKERTAYDQTVARQEDAVREADRLDPDINHRSDEYQPDLDASDPRRNQGGNGSRETHDGRGSHAAGSAQPGTHSDTHPDSHSDSQGTRSHGDANPAPDGPETIVPEGYQDTPDRRRDDQV